MKKIPTTPPENDGDAEPPFSSEEFLAVMGAGRTIESYAKGAEIFAQGDLADSVY